MTLPPGKIPIDILKQIVFKNLGTPRKEIKVGPTAGIDNAVIDIGEKSLIISMDPITGAQERIGWLAVNVNANDIATSGAEPAFLFTCLMLPQNAHKNMVQTISAQMNQAAQELNMAIVGGHAESTPNLTHPIVVACAIGYTQKGKYITSANAKPNDKIILTKTAGIEGTAILASDRENQLKTTLTNEELQKAKDFYQKISIVKDALTAYKTGGVHAMHDPTEGGITGGIHEMADAANLGIHISRERIQVEPETAKICNYFNIDPLQLIGSGALLIAAQPRKASTIAKSLNKSNIPAAIIGEFLPDKTQRIITMPNGKTETLPRPTADHLWQALSRR